MQHLLILFADRFPYNTGEPFLENENPLYGQYFDKVLLSTACKKGEQPTRDLDGELFEVLPDHTLSKDLRSVLEALPWLLTDGLFWSELGSLLFREGFSLRKLYDLTVMSLCGNHRAMQTCRWLKNHPEYTFDCLYSYWINIPSYAAIRLRKKLKRPELRIVARCHGYDIYKERKTTGYLPFQGRILRELSYVGAASSDAKGYLQALYPQLTNLSVHFLGARDMGQRNPDVERRVFRLVSCAYVKPVKCLTKIVDTLATIKDRDIHWTHIGGGEGLEALKAMAEEKLPANIQTEFMGNIPNSEIYRVYREKPFHAFVSASASEGGAPVSVCEAISYGIPAILTAVGGHLDVVCQGVNGYLVEKDFADAQFAEAICRMADLDELSYQSFRREARLQFESKFQALKNNQQFLEDVLLSKKLR